MTEYRLRIVTATGGYRERISIPEDAKFVQVEYDEPVGRYQPSNRATVKFLEPVEDEQ